MHAKDYMQPTSQGPFRCISLDIHTTTLSVNGAAGRHNANSQTNKTSTLRLLSSHQSMENADSSRLNELPISMSW
ncbi:hypothetical protein BDR06DRAFT_955492 [Suillus hirtellus]|nr:hypothetical protein BDR06DRAFT_955492 [Suillus hirtellus]